ncbi:MAG: SRPBCC domain-containing protein [Polyangiales bacterium]
MSTPRIDRASLELATAPQAVFGALADPVQLMKWLPPNDMTGRAVAYDFRVGGRYEIELRYADGTGTGKSSEHTDVTQGRFLAIEPDRRVVQTVVFTSDDPAFAGEMTMTWSLQPTARGTLVTVTAENVPSGISKEDHDEGLRASLDNLAGLFG